MTVKKEHSTEMTVEEKIKALFQLQTTLSGIDEKRALRGELPDFLQHLFVGAPKLLYLLVLLGGACEHLFRL